MVAKRSTKMGKIHPYVDVRSPSDVPKFESLLKTGPVFVLVYADWCGHCKRFKSNMWDEVANSTNKSKNTAAVHYDMVNKTSMRNTPIEGYPTLFEVKPSGKTNVSTPVATPQSKAELETMVGMNEGEDPGAVNTTPTQNNMASEPLNSNENMIRSARMSENSRTATAATFKPMESLPPPEEENEPSEPTTVASAPQGGGSLMESLLKVAADSAHVLVLAGSAAELSRRYKKRKGKTHRRSSKKRQTRRR